MARRVSEALELLDDEMDGVLADDPEMYGDVMHGFMYGFRLGVSSVARLEVPQSVLDDVAGPIYEALIAAGVAEDEARSRAGACARICIRRAWTRLFDLRPGEPGGARKPR